MIRNRFLAIAVVVQLSTALSHPGTLNEKPLLLRSSSIVFWNRQREEEWVNVLGVRTKDAGRLFEAFKYSGIPMVFETDLGWGSFVVQRQKLESARKILKRVVQRYRIAVVWG